MRVVVLDTVKKSVAEIHEGTINGDIDLEESTLLYQDLSFDSLDYVELIMLLEENLSDRINTQVVLPPEADDIPYDISIGDLTNKIMEWVDFS